MAISSKYYATKYVKNTLKVSIILAAFIIYNILFEQLELNHVRFLVVFLSSLSSLCICILHYFSPPRKYSYLSSPIFLPHLAPSPAHSVSFSPSQHFFRSSKPSHFFLGATSHSSKLSALLLLYHNLSVMPFIPCNYFCNLDRS